MTGYVRKDTTNNIADGNVINAADLDAEFDGVQDAFNASTGHKHDGTAGEGATINALGPTQDVTISSTLLAPKTTNTVDIGSSSLKFKDLFLAGNASVGGTLAVTGVATLTAQPILSSLTASRAVFTDGSKGLVSNAITGTGNVVMSASPTLTGTAGFENITASGTLGVTGVATFTAQPIVSSLTASRAVFSDGSKGLVSNAITGTGNVVMSASPTLTGTISAEALTASSSVTLSGGTANGVAYLNGSKVLTSGSALTFDGTNLGVGGTATSFGAGYSVLQVTGASGGYQLQSSGTVVSQVGADSGYAGVRFGTRSAHPIIFTYNDSEQMRLTSTGLGIGTSSPSVKLHVLNGADGTIATFSRTGASNNPRLFIQTTEATALVSLTADGGAAYSSLGFNTGGSERMRLDTSGNVGIGTSSPSAKLHVYKSNQNQLQLQCDDTGQVNINMGGTTTPAKGAIYFSDNSGSMWFNTASTQRMTLDSSGNLGLGVTPNAGTSGRVLQTSNAGHFMASGPVVYIDANAYFDSGWKYITTAAASNYYQSSGAHIWNTAASGTAGSAISFTQAMTLDASGNLGVGTTSPVVRVHVAGRLRVVEDTSIADLGSSTTGVYLYNRSNSALSFGTNDTERARIDSSGNLLVAKTALSGTSIGFQFKATGELNSGMAASTNSDSTLSVYSTGASAYRFYVGLGGTVYATSTTITAISDQRLKENIRDLDEGLATVMALKPRKFDWKAGKGQDIKNARGFIAQEFETVLPDMIETWRDPAPEGEEPYKAINANLIPTLVKALQEQQAIIESLKARLDAANL